MPVFVTGVARWLFLALGSPPALGEGRSSDPLAETDMFTGIITDVGRVLSLDHRGDLHARIGTAYETAGIDIGASIACNGVCLTVTETGPDWFGVTISSETLSKSTLGGWAEGTRVNLERALRVGDELGGHIVSGHVDGVAEIVATRDEGELDALHLPRARHTCPFHRAERLRRA